MTSQDLDFCTRGWLYRHCSFTTAGKQCVLRGCPLLSINTEYFGSKVCQCDRGCKCSWFLYNVHSTATVYGPQDLGKNWICPHRRNVALVLRFLACTSTACEQCIYTPSLKGSCLTHLQTKSTVSHMKETQACIVKFDVMLSRILLAYKVWCNYYMNIYVANLNIFTPQMIGMTCFCDEQPQRSKPSQPKQSRILKAQMCTNNLRFNVILVNVTLTSCTCKTWRTLKLRL